MSKAPMNFSRTPAEIKTLAPRLGENSVEVLREIGLAEQTIEAMLSSGALGVPK